MGPRHYPFHHNPSRPPAVSVVLPVHNAEQTLAATLDSLLGQTFPDFEIVAVDDGSSDRSPAILARYARRDNRIKPLLLPHGGIVAALNQGIAAAQGAYVARMDADDICLPDRIGAQKQFLDSRPDLGLVSCRVGFLGDKRESRGYFEYVRWTNSLLTPDTIGLNRFVESPLAHPSIMIRTELLRRHGGYRQGDFPEDYELWLRLLDAGVAMAKLDRMLLAWRDHPLRLSRIHPRYAPEAFYRIKAEFLARWLKRNNPHHPSVILWGAGRPTRKRAALLCEHGIRIRAFLDVDLRKIGNTIHEVPVLSPDQIPPPGQCFILPYVGSRGARKEILWMLNRLGYRIGRDFIPGA
jgi:glycosyltransferase involved in cell wall biosynthesis